MTVLTKPRPAPAPVRKRPRICHIHALGTDPPKALCGAPIDIGTDAHTIIGCIKAGHERCIVCVDLHKGGSR